MTGVDTEGHATDVGGAGDHPDRVFVGGSFPASSASAPVPPCDGRLVLAQPTPGTAYHTAYFSPTNDEETVTDASIEVFEAMTGREVAGVVFSDPCGHGGKLEIGFPRTKVKTVWRHGALPMVRMMPRESRRVADGRSAVPAARAGVRVAPTCSSALPRIAMAPREA